MKTLANYTRYLLTAAVLATTITGSCFADADEEHVPIGTRSLTEKPLSFFGIQAKSTSEEEHVPVGDRRLSQVEHVKFQEKRALKADEKQQHIMPRTEEEEELIAKKHYVTSHEGVFHRPIAITALGDQVTLEDGSVWHVRDSDRIKTLDWLAGDTILILPNHTWFSSYYFVLYNQNTGAEVRVNMALGPIYNGVYTHWIVAIDYYNKELCLEDGSVWKISGGDHGIMKKWLTNDTIIIGINDAWFSSKPNILINVNMLNYVAGICQN